MSALGQLQPARYYHIFVAADNGRALFAHRDDYHAFLRHYRRLLAPVVDTFAYCLLPNHLHLFVRIKTLRQQVAYWYEQGDMVAFAPLVAADQFAQLPVVADLLTALIVPARLDATHLIRYIHRNPTHHQIADFRIYNWSSYRVIMQNRATFINRETVLRWFYSVEWYEDAHWETADLARIGYLIAKD